MGIELIRESTKRARARAWLSAAVVLACGLSAAGTAGATADAKDIVMIGSSSVNGSLGYVVGQALKGEGHSVWRKGYASSGFARPDFRDMLEVAKTLPVSDRTKAVVVYLGVNDGQNLWLRPEERGDAKEAWVKWADERWSTTYEQRTRDFIEALCQRGVQSTIVLLPVDVVSPAMHKRLERIRQLQAKAAAASTCGVALATGGDVGKFEGEGWSTRTPDGSHMTEIGARKVWNRVKDEVLRRVRGERGDALPGGTTGGGGGASLQ